MAEDKDYVCPQCGPDPNGGEIHSLTHHSTAFFTVDEAKEYIKNGYQTTPYMNSRRISCSAGVLVCDTKEKFLAAQLIALTDCKNLASSVSMEMLLSIQTEADTLFGKTIFD